MTAFGRLVSVSKRAPPPPPLATAELGAAASDGSVSAAIERSNTSSSTQTHLYTPGRCITGPTRSQSSLHISLPPSASHAESAPAAPAPIARALEPRSGRPGASLAQSAARLLARFLAYRTSNMDAFSSRPRLPRGTRENRAHDTRRGNDTAPAWMYASRQSWTAVGSQLSAGKDETDGSCAGPGGNARGTIGKELQVGTSLRRSGRAVFDMSSVGPLFDWRYLFRTSFAPANAPASSGT
mmetsp:Transcript_16748/g.38361  ORF Transcript_16748/g.38361 Transcript_16748/m.38361 type:complete len:240 (-) Transcript_16748:1160-1879(-)